MVPYATVTDLDAYLPSDVPRLPVEDAERLLTRASETVADAIVTGYDPDRADVIEGLKLATCAQAHAWLTVGAEASVTSVGVQAERVGNLSVTYSGGAGVAGAAGTLAPGAARHLRLVGLGDRQVTTWTSREWPGRWRTRLGDSLGERRW